MKAPRPLKICHHVNQKLSTFRRTSNYPVDGENKLLRNISNNLPICTMSSLRRPRKLFSPSGTEILLMDASRVSYVACNITRHSIKFRVVSVYLTPLLSCINGMCVIRNYEMQIFMVAARINNITLYYPTNALNCVNCRLLTTH